MSKFDPMTGELITDEAVENNPETEGKIIGYDPMTGEPIREAVQKPEAEGKIIGYDPMTGEPIREAVQKPEAEGEIIGYDPMTGEPIRSNANSNQPEMNFDPMTGLPVAYTGGGTAGTENGSTKKSGKNKILFGIVAAVAVLALIGIVVFACISSGLFMSKRNKVLVAVANTFDGKFKLVEDLNVAGMLAADKYTVGTELDTELDGEDLILTASYANSGKDKQISVSGSYDYIPDVSVVAALTKSEVKLQGSPVIDDYVFVYNYVKEKDGALIELLNDELGDDAGEACFALIDLACKKAYSGDELTKEVTKIIIEEYQSLEYEKVDKKEFEIGGKDRKCEGYRTEITEDNLINILEKLEEVLQKESEDLNELMEELTGTSVSTDELIDELKDEIDFSDIELTFYIYKNELACIALEVEKEEFELLFTNEKNEQTIELVYDDETIMELVIESEGHTETYTMEAMGMEYGVIEYDYKSGNVEFDFFDGEIEGEGLVQSSAKEKSFEILDLEVYGEDMGTGRVFVRSGADMHKFSGEEFDVGNASESDFEDLEEELMEIVELMDLY